MKPVKEPLYESLKRRLLNNRLIVALMFLGIVMGFLASMKESILKLLPGPSSASRLTLVGTVLDERGYCGPGGETPDLKDEENMIQKATLDLAINNPSKEAHIITALLLEPIHLHGSFWAGELKVGARYDVVLDEWWNKVMDANMKAREEGLDEPRILPTLPTIGVKEIVDKKYTIDSGSQERFQVRLGLTNSNNFLYGTVRVTIKTDREAKLISQPLSVVVCTPELTLKSGL
jgi:hypothetical protein